MTESNGPALSRASESSAAEFRPVKDKMTRVASLQLRDDYAVMPWSLKWVSVDRHHERGDWGVRGARGARRLFSCRSRQLLASAIQ